MNSKTFQHIVFILWYLLIANTTFAYTRQDTLRGGNGEGRSWWDVQHYNLSITFDTGRRMIFGRNVITMKLKEDAGERMQLDLQEPMVLDKISWNEMPLETVREGNVYWVKVPPKQWQAGAEHTLVVDYHGKPKEAVRPPWDGGFIWAKDASGKPWVAVACQGLGASAWWPCKDYQADEPDKGMTLAMKFPARLTAISNGKQFLGETDCDGNILSTWAVASPINTYNMSFYIGDYVHWSDTLMGEKGKLNLDFYALRQNEEKARRQFAVTKQMLHCFEHWMGPYPFYEDGYKLVESPYLGMEHQSAIAYGNEYQPGYRGMDRSNTGVGMLFDYIIIHESGHEWFGNNITAADVADNWIHEGFTSYTEALFAECAFGKEKAYDYTRGAWRTIENDKPVIGNYGVRDDGSGDKYNKGAAVVHMVRVMMNDDNKFRNMLREMNAKYYHGIVTSAEIEQFMANYSQLNLKPLFDHYLRKKDIPELEYTVKRNKITYRFTNTDTGFTLPLTVTGSGNTVNISPTSEWQTTEWKGGADISFSKDFLIKPKP